MRTRLLACLLTPKVLSKASTTDSYQTPKDVRDEVGALLQCEGVEKFPEAIPKSVDGALGGSTKQGLEL